MAKDYQVRVHYDWKQHQLKSAVLHLYATASQPGSPTAGQVGFDTDKNVPEYYGGITAGYYQLASTDQLTYDNQLIVAKDVSANAYHVHAWDGDAGYVKVDENGVVSVTDAGMANLDFTTDDGPTEGSIALASEVLDFEGTIKEVVTSLPGGAGSNQVVFGLPDTIRVVNDIEDGQAEGADDSAHNLWTGCGTFDITIGGGTSTVVVPGNLHVQGTTTTIDTDVLRVEDPMIEIARKNTVAEGGGDSLDQGIYGNYVDSTTDRQWAIWRDASVSYVQAGIGREIVIAENVSVSSNTVMTTSAWYSHVRMGAAILGVSATQDGILKFYNGSNAHKVQIQQDGAHAEDTTYYWPLNMPDTNDEILVSSTGGQWAWKTIDELTGGDTLNGSGVAEEVTVWLDTDTITSYDTFVFDDETDSLLIGKASTAGIVKIFGSSGSVSFDVLATSGDVTYSWPTAPIANGYLKTDASGDLSWDTATSGIPDSKELTFTNLEEAGGWYDDTAANGEYTITCVNSGAAGDGQQNHGLGASMKYDVIVWEKIGSTPDTYQEVTSGVVVTVNTDGDIKIHSSETFIGKINLIRMHA